MSRYVLPEFFGRTFRSYFLSALFGRTFCPHYDLYKIPIPDLYKTHTAVSIAFNPEFDKTSASEEQKAWHAEQNFYW